MLLCPTVYLRGVSEEETWQYRISLRQPQILLYCISNDGSGLTRVSVTLRSISLCLDTSGKSIVTTSSSSVPACFPLIPRGWGGVSEVYMGGGGGVSEP